MRLPKQLVKQYGKSLGKTIVCTAAALAAFTAITKVVPYSLVYNRTESIPLGLYLMKEVSPDEVKVGDIGCFSYSAPEWAEERRYFPPRFRLCKPVFAGPGALVKRVDDDLWVQQPGGPLLKVATLSAKDKGGRPLKQDAIPKSGPIPSYHWLMLASDRNNSFDSRYLGYIPMRAVRYKAIPLATW